jgi:hypothetical protein
MKITRISKTGNMLEIEMETGQKPKWFFLSPKVAAFSKNFAAGDEVEFSHEEQNGEDTITFIKKVGASPTNAPVGAQPVRTFSKNNYGDDAERQDSIRKQSMMKAAADAVSRAMQGQVDINTLGDQICSLYDKILAKITN